MATVPSTISGVSPKVVPSITSGFSPKLPFTNELSSMEEGKMTPSPEPEVSDIVFPTTFQKVMAELLGTYILMFVGLGSVLISYKQPLTIVGIAVAWGLVVMVMIYTFGHISGGHFNPAVTIASAVSCKFPWRHVPKYIGVQLLASTLAALTLSVLFHGQESIGDTLTLYKSPTTTFEALTWEFIISFILMLTVCGVATDHRAINELSGVAVGAAILFNCLIAGPITGASMNPARSIGPAIVSGNYSNIWVYIVAPILGTTAAGFIYSFLRLPLAKTSESTTKSI